MTTAAERAKKHRKRLREWKPLKAPKQMTLPLWPLGMPDQRMRDAARVTYRARKTEWERLNGNAQRRTPEGWAAQAWRRLQKRSYELRTPFDLAPSDLIPGVRCPIRGTTFVYGELSHPDSPSVDKLIPALGYVKGNVAVISRRANQIKSDCTSGDELRQVADWLDAELKKSRENKSSC